MASIGQEVAPTFWTLIRGEAFGNRFVCKRIFSKPHVMEVCVIDFHMPLAEVCHKGGWPFFLTRSRRILRSM